MSMISYSYWLVSPARILRGGYRAHIVQCEHFPPGSLRVARDRVLCGARTGASIDDRPARASCPPCRREFARITAEAAAAWVTGPDLITCPDGCTRPGGRPVLCCPVCNDDAGAPYATGAFRCPLCRREHTPGNQHEGGS
jgi:hypothetical protein